MLRGFKLSAKLRLASPPASSDGNDQRGLYRASRRNLHLSFRGQHTHTPHSHRTSPTNPTKKPPAPRQWRCHPCQRRRNTAAKWPGNEHRTDDNTNRTPASPTPKPPKRANKQGTFTIRAKNEELNAKTAHPSHKDSVCGHSSSGRPDKRSGFSSSIRMPKRKRGERQRRGPCKRRIEGKTTPAPT